MILSRIHIGRILVASLTLAAASLRADNDVILDFPGADVNIGERLFLETRFSQYFFAHANGDANALIPGDPVVARLKTTAGSVPGPFAGQAINCRQCHLVDEKGFGPFGDHTLGNRTYADFTRRTPIPSRDDGRTQTPRNSPILVDALLPRDVPLFLHLDGQFASAHDLIVGTLTGRNYGWKPDEYATAVHHIATIIREDNAEGYLAVEARGARFRVLESYLAEYRNIFAGFSDYNGSYIWDPRALVPDLISPQYRIDMRTASDEQILDTIATLIEAYLKNLTFSQATNGVDFVGVGTPIFNGSPFDVFLIKNNLPQRPDDGETSSQYSRRLLQLVSHLSSPGFVSDPADGSFSTQKQAQSFKFGRTELEGLKIFLNDRISAPQNRTVSVGNCASCHSLPAFTDFLFHNTGATQEEYDSIRGPGKFSKLEIPDLATRQADYNSYLPATPTHPKAKGIFETPPNRQDARLVDLGLWNVYANPDFPGPQPGLSQIVPLLLGIPSPRIVTAAMSGNQFVFSGTNGVPGGTFYVLAAGKFLQPSTAWTAIATNTFDPSGNFVVSTPVSPSARQTFYQLSMTQPSPAEVLPKTIALFKTPTVRDLAHSGPYLHTGRKNSIKDVLRFYQLFSRKARQGAVRNVDPKLADIVLDDSDIDPLAAFLRSLNEDYTD